MVVRLLLMVIFLGTGTFGKSDETPESLPQLLQRYERYVEDPRFAIESLQSYIRTFQKMLRHFPHSNAAREKVLDGLNPHGDPVLVQTNLLLMENFLNSQRAYLWTVPPSVTFETALLRLLEDYGAVSAHLRPYVKNPAHLQLDRKARGQFGNLVGRMEHISEQALERLVDDVVLNPFVDKDTWIVSLPALHTHFRGELHGRVLNRILAAYPDLSWELFSPAGPGETSFSLGQSLMSLHGLSTSQKSQIRFCLLRVFYQFYWRWFFHGVRADPFMDEWLERSPDFHVRMAELWHHIFDMELPDALVGDLSEVLELSERAYLGTIAWLLERPLTQVEESAIKGILFDARTMEARFSSETWAGASNTDITRTLAMVKASNKVYIKNVRERLKQAGFRGRSKRDPNLKEFRLLLASGVLPVPPHKLTQCITHFEERYH